MTDKLRFNTEIEEAAAKIDKESFLDFLCTLQGSRRACYAVLRTNLTVVELASLPDAKIMSRGLKGQGLGKAGVEMVNKALSLYSIALKNNSSDQPKD